MSGFSNAVIFQPIPSSDCSNSLGTTAARGAVCSGSGARGCARSARGFALANAPSICSSTAFGSKSPTAMKVMLFGTYHEW